MNPLRQLAEGFDRLAKSVEPNGSPPMTVKALADACHPLLAIIPLMGGHATRSWEQEIVGKVRALERASNVMSTLEELIDQDQRNNCARFLDSNSRVLVRLRRSIEGVKVLAEELLKGRHISLQTAAHTAYMTIFARYHDSTTRHTASEAISIFPGRELILRLINETEDNADILLRMYVNASTLVVNYIDRVFASKGLRTDW